MQKLKEQILEELNILKLEYCDRVTEKEEMITLGKPQLEAAYATKIGKYMIMRLKLQLQIKGLKRKIELIQSCINRFENFDLNLIELQVAQELASAELEIMDETSKVEKSRFILTHLESPERSAQLRKIYLSLAKKLHPDLNPECQTNPILMEIWHQISECYAECSLERLQAICLIYEDVINNLEDGMNTLSEEQILSRIEILKESLKTLHHEIALLNSKFPFTIKNKIYDNDWVKDQADAILRDLSELKLYEDELQLKFNELIN